MAQKLFEKLDPNLKLTRYAQAALTEYYLVRTYSSGTEQVQQSATAGELCLGVADGDYDADDEACGINTGPYVLVKAGAAVNEGDVVASDGAGRVIPATTAHPWILGIARTTCTAANDLVTIRWAPVPNGQLLSDSNRAARRVHVIGIDYADGTSETDTGWDIPTYAIVHDVWLYVATAEVTGGTKTIDVGTDGSGSNDPDGFLDGVSVAATGWVRGKPTFTAGSNETYFSGSIKGDLLAPTQVAGSDLATDVGTYWEAPDDTSGGESLTWTPGSADFAELVAYIFIDYTEANFS
jgi:hypothetical protein